MSDAAFFSQKIRTLFNRFDMDQNGMLEVEDFNQWSAKLAQIGGLNVERTATLAENLTKIWDIYFSPADTNKDGSVEIPELVTHMRASLTDSTKRKAIESTIPLIFDAIDLNLDGGIAADEFAAFFKSLGVEDAKFATNVFRAMDTNNDGVLSREEFSAFGTEFFLGTNSSSPSRFFFGPLVN